jgi:hypothetical protein
MSHSLLSVLALALLGGQADAPEIVNPHATYGYLGAPRPKGEGILPGDVAHVSFEIKNLKADGTGRVAYSIAIVITDDGGKVVYEQKPQNAVAQHFFGGTTLRAVAHIDLPLDAKAGPRHWKVTVTDRTTGKSTSLEGKGKVLAPDFGLVRIGTYADVEDKVPTPPVGVVGGNLYLSFGVVGFGRAKVGGQPDLKVSLRILDDKGKATLANPLTGVVNKDVPADVRILPLQFGLTLDRVGRYTLELTAQDQVNGKTSVVSFPVRILAGE